MSRIVLYTGGARSGKSSLAEDEAKELGKNQVLYIATAAVCDEEMADRVKKHRARRPEEWATWEGFWNFRELEQSRDFVNCQAMLVDCLGFMLNNIMYRLVSDWENCRLEEMEAVEERMLREVDTLIRLAREREKSLIVVTNEVGMGLVPAERSSRYYRDILGRANRRVAEAADRVCFMVSGIPLVVKESDGKTTSEVLSIGRRA